MLPLIIHSQQIGSKHIFKIIQFKWSSCYASLTDTSVNAWMSFLVVCTDKEDTMYISTCLPKFSCLKKKSYFSSSLRTNWEWSLYQKIITKHQQVCEFIKFNGILPKVRQLIVICCVKVKLYYKAMNQIILQ
jgi:hypothetical protein